MPKITFVCEHQHPINKDSNLATLTYESNREYLYDIVEDFEDFLRGCGFHFDGKLDFVDTEDIGVNFDTIDFPASSVTTDSFTISSSGNPFNSNLDGMYNG